MLLLLRDTTTAVVAYVVYIATAKAVRALGAGHAPSHHVDTQTCRVVRRIDF